MKFNDILNKPGFLFREEEKAKIIKLTKGESPQILAVYGRRRVGKSELIANALKAQSAVKIEGIQGLSQSEQIVRALKQLSVCLEDIDVKNLRIDSWFDFLDLFVRRANFSNPFVLYLEEIQWLANYSSAFISDLKYYWDNHLQYKGGFSLILCGSSPSFVINEVLNSAALYNRSQHHIHLQPFTLLETKQFLQKDHSNLQIMDAYLTLGGIPEYLNYIKRQKSILLSICEHSFLKDSFFSKEHERIFISSLRDNKNYKYIVQILAVKRFATRDQILKSLNRKSGGDISELLRELELVGFISSYSPYDKSNSLKLRRYQINDPYLQFYFKFIKPVEDSITEALFDKDPLRALNTHEYSTWLGFQFERWCRANHYSIASLLGFQSVKYKHGAFFSRNSDSLDKGFQWDLVFERKDKVLTLCEVKYLKTEADVKVASEFESKLAFIPEKKLNSYGIEKILITTIGASKSLRELGYFDKILTLDDIMPFPL